MAIGKSFKLKKQKMTKGSIRIFRLTQKLGKNFNYRHHIEPRSSTYVPREELFLITKSCIIERNSSDEKSSTRGWRIGEAKTSEAKQIQLYMVLQGKDGIVYLVTTLRKNSFR